jgi:large subunit ribosomal protein L19e
MNLTNQKKLATRLLKCGMSRVWFEPSRMEDIANAITGSDIRALIKDGVIKAKPKKGNSSFRIKKIEEQKKKGRRKGKGSRKGKIGTRAPRKREWIKKVRALRKELAGLKERMKSSDYRNVYRKISGGFFHSRAHMRTYLERNDLIKEVKKNAKTT